MSDAIFYESLMRELFVYLRGNTSQQELSKILGYSFNQVGKWESSVTSPSWDDFVQLNDVKQIDWKSHFQNTFCFHSKQNFSDSSVFEILTKFIGDSHLSDLSVKLNKSKSTISRMRNNQVKIDFTDILKIIDMKPFLLITWLSKFVDVKTIPSLQKKSLDEAAIARGILSVPWAVLVGSALQLEEYINSPKHDEAWIAKKTGLTVDQVQLALQNLLRHQAIAFVNEKYECCYREFSFLRVPEFRKVTQFLMNQASQAYNPEKPETPDLNNPSVVASIVYALSSRASQRLTSEIVNFHQKVREIILNDSEPKDHIRTIIIQSLDSQKLADISKNEK